MVDTGNEFAFHLGSSSARRAASASSRTALPDAISFEQRQRGRHGAVPAKHDTRSDLPRRRPLMRLLRKEPVNRSVIRTGMKSTRPASPLVGKEENRVKEMGMSAVHEV